MISDSSSYDTVLQIGQIDQQACCRKDDEKLFEIAQQDLFLSNGKMLRVQSGLFSYALFQPSVASRNHRKQVFERELHRSFQVQGSKAKNFLKNGKIKLFPPRPLGELRQLRMPIHVSQ